MTHFVVSNLITFSLDFLMLHSRSEKGSTQTFVGREETLVGGTLIGGEFSLKISCQKLRKK